jgi:hypothetical protein
MSGFRRASRWCESAIGQRGSVERLTLRRGALAERARSAQRGARLPLNRVPVMKKMMILD